MAIRSRRKIGKIIPASLGIVLFFESSISINKTPQTSSAETIEMKLNIDTFKKRTLIGTKKKMMITSKGA